MLASWESDGSRPSARALAGTRREQTRFIAASGHGFMQAHQLHGIKRRAEHAESLRAAALKEMK